jgi:chromosome segregation protein
MEVHFPGDGITCVVGPNGCGKSNIVDAIRWVLGEQRAKQLRSSKMEDVIFSGTAERPAMNVAEVSLIINNDKGLLPSEYTEIQITRRAYRSGESEYLINNQECRLKDIHNLFYDTGMGAASYSLMEARMIDAILSDNTEDRRQLFEEAAGISKYKQQRKETLRQLDKTALDLARVEDNLKHVRQSVGQYERQAKKAEEWRTINTRLRNLEISLFLDRFEFYAKELQTRSAKKEAEVQAREELMTRKTVLEGMLEEKKLSILEEEEAYRTADQKVSQRQLLIQALQGAREKKTERMRYIEESFARAESEIEECQTRIQEIGEERLIRKEDLDELRVTLKEHTERLRSFEAGTLDIRQQHEAARQQSERLTKERMQLLEQHAQARNKADRAEQQRQFLALQMQQLESDEASLNERIAELQQKIAGMASTEEDQATLELLQERKLAEKSRLEDLRVQLSELNSQERKAYEWRVGLEKELRILEKMAQAGEGLGAGVKHLLNQKSAWVQGILADHIKVPAKWQSAVEFCLGELTETLFLQPSQDPQELVSYLQKGNLGWVFALIPGLGSSWEQGFKPSAITTLADVVEYKSETAQSFGALLDMYALCDSGQEALDQATKCNVPLWFVTPAGFCVHSSGLFKGGSSAGAGASVLQRTSRLEELQAQWEQASQQLEELVAKRQESSELTEEVQSVLSSLEEDEFELQSSLRDRQKELQFHSNQLSDLQKRLQTLLQQRAKLEQQKQELEGGSNGAGDQLTELETKKQELEAVYTQALEALHALDAQKNEQEELFRSLSSEVQHWKNKETQMLSQLDYLETQLADTRNLLEKRTQEKEDSLENKEESLAAIAEIDEKMYGAMEALDAEMEARDQAKSIYDEKATGMDDLREESKEVTNQIQSKTAAVHELEIRCQNLTGQMERLREKIFESWELDLEEPGDFKKVEYAPDVVEEEIREARERIKKLGSINPGAVEEYEEGKKHLETVEKQFEDLDQARLSLEKTIRRLDKIARDRFLETFNQVRRNFQEVFSSLMTGGEAKLNLEDDKDPLESKIEINARPTGKKMRGVALLSGGERALTATALLFALYMVKPSPYCILDEVDGPLDDANIGRFVQLLRRFSRQTQFIVVTHNKRTMAASDRLYGVTQEIKGISQIASVLLDEAAGMVG